MGSAPTGTIALDPTFGKFHLIRIGCTLCTLNRFLWWKCLDSLDRNGFFLFWCSECGHRRLDVRHLVYWEGQRVCDALFKATIVTMVQCPSGAFCSSVNDGCEATRHDGLSVFVCLVAKKLLQRQGDFPFLVLPRGKESQCCCCSSYCSSLHSFLFLKVNVVVLYSCS